MKILYQARGSKVTVDATLSAILASFGTEYSNYDSSTAGHIKSGKYGLNDDFISAVRSCSEAAAYEGVQKNLIPILRSNCLIGIVRAIKAVLRDDATIAKETVVGYGNGYKKSSILSTTTVTFNEFLANILYYSIVNVSSSECVEATKEVDKDYLESFISAGEEVYLETASSQSFVPLKKSLKGNDFGNTFFKVAECTVEGMANPASAHFYTTDISNCTIKFQTLKKYLLDHIGEYVLSRETISNYEKSGRDFSVGLNAFLTLAQKNKNGTVWSSSTLGEILLYLFLEQELGAPKILSKIEVTNVSGTTESKCDGVHLLSLASDGLPFHQLVFGASDVVNDLNSAVDNAFSKIEDIRSNEGNELQMVENTIYNNIYDPETTKFMENLILPKAPGADKPEMAFGVFLGYTLGLDGAGLSGPQYKSAVQNKILADIKSAEAYISGKIRSLHLEGYSFYFYVLPFNNAVSERESIINDAFSGGAV